MQPTRANDGSALKSELARYCLPGAKRDPERRLAWVNSICILFLLVGTFGARREAVAIKKLPPLELPVPAIIEPTPPSPETSMQQQEQSLKDKPEVPRFVVVTPESPAIQFAVPTIGTMVVPTTMAKPPPVMELKQLTPIRGQPASLNSTGKGGDRPQPPYPKLALEQAEQGTVILRLIVDDTGLITSAEVKESSGHPILDRGALDYVKRHWILPRGVGGRVYEAPIRFLLQMSN